MHFLALECCSVEYEKGMLQRRASQPYEFSVMVLN